MATPTDLKQVQKLVGCMAALSRFISRLGEKALPLYRLLRRTDNFEWTDAATAGLEEIKALLETTQSWRTKHWRAHVVIHIGNTSGGERRAHRLTRIGRTQISALKPVYYVSTVLTPCKSRYPHYQKIACAVFMASRKLRH